MNVYTVEINSETATSKEYQTVRCPHNSSDGHRCNRQLFKLRCSGTATIEIKCPKCKTVLRVYVVDLTSDCAIEQR